MREALEKNPKSLVIGQGVTDFKTIFGTLEGLVDDYPDRLIETPLSEDSVAGLCIGASLNGMYPINTHIRADFGLLIFNQLVNLAAKYRYMFGGNFRLPMLIRLVIGRSWGQGAQHSQSLQSLLAHIPGLTVIMPSSPAAVIESYSFAVNNFKSPVISFEHRLLYELSFDEEKANLSHPLFGSRIVKKGADITIVATSVMVLECKRASNFLKSVDIDAEIIDLHSISHPDENTILKSIEKTGLLLVADTSWTKFGVSSEIVRLVAEKGYNFKRPPRFLGMAQAPCPTSKSLEDIFYPDVHDIVLTIINMVRGSTEGILLPEKQSMTDYYKHFKGPF